MIVFFTKITVQKLLPQKKPNDKIVVECKSFIKLSPIQDFKEALGQYMMYLPLLAQQAPEYRLYIAIDTSAYQSAFQRQIVQFLVQLHQIPLIIVDLEKQEVSQWIT